MEEHICHETDYCTCDRSQLEPSEDCHIHGCGTWPPRCCICEKFLPHNIRNKVLYYIEENEN